MNPYSDKDRPAGTDIMPTAKDIAPAPLVTAAQSRSAHQLDENFETLESQLPMLNGENTPLPASTSASFDYGENYRRFRGHKTIIVTALSVVLLLGAFGFGLTSYVEHSNKKQIAQGNLANLNLKNLLSADPDKQSLHINYETLIDNGKKFTATGAVIIQNDQTAGFSIQNASGSNLMVADTSNGRVGIGQAPTGSARLQVSGNISVNGSILGNGYGLSNQGLSINGVLVCTVTGCTNQTVDLSPFARLAGNNNFSGINKFIAAGNIFVGDGSGLSALNASNVSQGTLADSRLSGNVALANGNNNFSGSNTFSAQIQASGGINATAYSVNGTAGSSFSCPGGQLLSDPVIQGGIITGGSCALGNGASVATLQQVYDASNPAQIILGSNGLIQIQDAATPLGSNLFEITNNGGASKYFSVSASGAQVNGNDVCTTAGNCSGVAGIGGSGTANTIAKFTGSGLTIGDSLLTDNGTTVTVGGNTNINGILGVNTITPTATLTIGTPTQTLTLQGDAATKLTAKSGSFTNSLVFAAPALANHTITIPNATGTVAVSASGPLALDAAGNLSCPTCITSAVTTVNTLSGALTLAGTANQITITPSGNTLTFSTPQNISTTSSPQFTNVNVTGQFQVNGSQISSANLSNDASLAKLNANQTFSGNNTFSSASNSFTGNGSGLTALNATNISTGTLSDSRLSANVALLGANQTFTGNNTFTLNTAGLSVQDAASPLGTDLFSVTDNTGVTKYFTVSATALQFLGNDVCTTAGNCSGVGGGVTTPGGTSGKIAKFTAGQTIGDSIISDDGSTVTVGGTLAVNTITPTATLTIGSATQTLILQGDASTKLTAKSGLITNSLVFATPTVSNKTITIPDASGTVTVSASGPLALDAAGNLTCPTCLTSGGGGSGGVSHINSLNGDITLAGTANQIIITPSGNTLTFSTPQDIATTSSPTFANINVASGGQYQLNGLQINSSVLSNDANLAKLDADQTFTGANIFSNSSNSFTGDGSGLTNVDAATLNGQAGSYYTDATNISAGTLNDARLSSNVPLKNAANTFTNTNAIQVTSATAFQVQNNLAADTLLTVDTTARSVSGGNLVKIGNSTGTDTNTTILVVDSASAAPTSNLGVLNGGLFYNSSTNHLSVIENGAVKELCNKTDLGCGSAGTTQTLAIVYANGASQTDETIALDSTRNGVLIRDNATPITGTLFGVQNSTGGTKYLDVTASGISVAGTIVATGDINTSGGAIQTNGTTRIDNSGNLSNIGNLSLSGTISGGTSITGSGDINSTGGSLQTNSITRIDNSGNLTNISNLDLSGSAAFQHGTDISTVGALDDLNFGNTSLLRLTGASTQTVDGLVNSAGNRDGEILTVVNAGSVSATIADEAAGSTAANRIRTGRGINISVAVNSSITLVYDSQASRWRVVGDVAGGAGAAVTSVGTLDSQTKSADGAVIVGNTIVLQTADASFAGLVSTGNQTFAGNKTLTGSTSVQNSTATAFQVQNSGASETLLTVDSTARSASGGNLVKIGNSTGTDGNTTILVLDSASAAPTSNLSVLNGGLYYNSSTNHINVIENGAVKELCNKTDLGCGSAGTVQTLGVVYTNGTSQSDETIALDSTRNGVLIRDNATPIGGTLFGVQNSTGGTKYLDVTTNGISTNGISVNGGNVAINGSIIFTSSASGSTIQATAMSGSYSIQDVIILNSSGLGSTTTVARDNRIYGVANGNGTGGTANVVVSGLMTVNLDAATTAGTLNPGDQLVTSTTAGKAMVDNNATTGIIGYVRTAKLAGVAQADIIIHTVRGQYAPIFRNDSDSASAFQVQNAGGSSTILDVDTSSSRVGIGTNAPGFTLDVRGLAASNSGFVLNTNSTSTGAIYKLANVGTGGVSTNDVVVLANDGGTAKVMDTTTSRDTNIYGVAAGTAASGGSTNIVVSGNFVVNVDTAAVNIGDQLVTSTTVGQATVDNNATTGILGYALTSKAGGSAGTVNVLVRPVRGQYTPIFRNATDSTTAFQIQNAAGTSLLAADTSNNRLNVSGDINIGTIFGSRSFTDNFESGNIGMWDNFTGSLQPSVQSTTTHSGKYAAQFNPSGTDSSLTYSFGNNGTPNTHTQYARAWVNVSSQTSSTIDLVGIGQSSNGSRWTLYRDSSLAQLCLFNGIASVTEGCWGSFTTSAWHKIELRITSAGTSTGTSQVWFDGTQVFNDSTRNNGTSLNPSYLVIGSTGSRTANYFIDDFSADWSADISNSASLNVDENLHVGGSTSLGGSLMIQSPESNSHIFSILNGDNSYFFNLDNSNFSLSTSASATFKNQANSSTAFRIQNATGTTTLFDADTTNGRIGIGTNAPTDTLEVVGNIVSKGTTWTSRTSAADNAWVSVAYGNGRFVAVGGTGVGNRVMTSPDGVNWTTRTSAADNSWVSVAYGNGLFVAVSWNGTNQVMTSPDGITWTARTAANSNAWESVTYGNGLFVAVANSGVGNRVMTSPDGVNWTARTSAADNSWFSVTYGNGLFVAVAGSGVGNRVMTSPDGINWTIRTSAADNSWLSVTYGNGLFVSVANNASSVMTSPDGITWTSRAVPVGNSWSSVTYGNGLFVAVGSSGTGNRVMTSPDGINWVTRTSAADNGWNGVTYGNGTFVAVSGTGSGNRVMTSGRNEATPFSANNIYQGGATIHGSSTFISDTNSTTTFQVQNAAGTNVLDVDTTNQRVSVGTTGTATSQLYVSGLTPVDITSGGVATASGPVPVYVQGRYAYVADYTANKLQVFDISNPASPVDVSGGGVATGSHPNYIQVAGRYAYVVDQSASKLQVFDISNPASPVDVSGGGVATGAGPSQLFVQGRYVYVTASTDNKLQVFDISNPAIPVNTGTAVTGNSPIGIYVQGRYAYITNALDNKLQIFDISNPTKPSDVTAGGVSTGASTQPSAVYVQGRYAYIGDVLANKLQVFDISNPASPVDVSSGGVATGTTPIALYVQDRYAYVANYGSNKLQVFDISNPASPVDVSAGGSTTGTQPNSVFVSGRYAYVADFGSSKLQVFDLGGAYVQQLEAGGAEIGTLQVDSNGQVNGNFNIQGGLSVGSGGIQNSGNLGVTGNANIQGNTFLSGGNNGLNKASISGFVRAGTCNGSGFTYFYQIMSVNSTGGETGMNPSSLGVNAACASTDPTNKITINWSAVSGVTAYKVYRSFTSGTLNSGYIGTTTGTSFDDIGQIATAQLPTIDTTKQLAVSGSSVFQTSTNTPFAFQVQNSTFDNILLVDTVNSRIAVNSYFTNQTFTLTQNALSTSTTGGSLAAGTYRYKVTAVDAANGETAASGEQSIVTTGSTSTVTVSWIANMPKVVAYKVYRTAVNGAVNSETYLTSTLGTVNGANLTYTDTGSLTLGATAPPATSSFYYNSQNNLTNANSLLQLSVGGYGTQTGQVYVGGVQPTDMTSGGVPTVTKPNNIYVLGRYAYIVSSAGSSDKLQIFDVSNPLTPIDVSNGGVATTNGPEAIYVQGHYAYIVTTANKLQVFDVSNPSTPVDVSGGGVNTGTTPDALYVQGRYAYVGTLVGNTLQVFDISNPATPVIISNFSTGIGHPTWIFVQGRYAYVTESNSQKLQIVDVSNPYRPVDVSSGGVSTTTGPSSVYVQGRYAYVVTNGGNKLQIFDISNPANATDVTGGGVATASSPYQIFVQGRYAYLTGAAASGKFQVFDVSNPAKPTDLTIGGIATGSTPTGLFVSGRYAYVNEWGANKMQVFDLGGEYTQQLEAGGAEFGTLQVNSNGQVAGDFNVQGGLNVGQSLQTAGNIGVSGGAYIQGGTVLGGGKNLIGPPTSLSATNPNNGLGSLAAGTYKYEVTAIDANGNETTISNETTGVTSAANLTLNLSWTAPTGGTVAGYKVYRTTGTSGVSGTEVYLTTVTTNSFSDTGAIALDTITPPTLDSTGQLTVKGSALFQNVTNSTTAFQIQNAAGTSNLFVADTTTNRIGIGTATPGYRLEVNGTPGGALSLIQYVTGSATSTSASNGSETYLAVSPGSASTARYEAIIGLTDSTSGNTSGATLVGVHGEARAATGGNVGTVIGGEFAGNNVIGTVQNAYGIQASIGGSSMTNAAGIAIDNAAAATNNTNLLIGTTTIPAGNYSIYNSSTYSNYLAGALGIGILPTSQVGLNISRSLGTIANSSAGAGINLAATATGAANGSSNVDGISSSLTLQGGNTSSWITGGKFFLTNGSTNNSTATANANGLYASLNNSNANTITTANTIEALTQLTGSGNITNYSGLKIDSPSASSTGTIGTAYGINIDPQKTAAVSGTAYGIYQGGSSDLNNFAGINTFTGSGNGSTVTGSLFKNASDSATALQVQTSGGNILLNINTADGYVVNNGTTSPGNALDNPGFEAGGGTGISGWTFTAGASIATDAANSHSGNREAVLTSAGASVSSAKYFQVVPNESYYFSAWVKNSAGATGVNASLAIFWYNKDKSLISTSLQNFSLPGTNYVLEDTAGLSTAPATAVYAQVVAGNGTGATGTWYFDDLFFAKSTMVAPILFKNYINTTSAFQVQNASSATLLNVDSTATVNLVANGGFEGSGTTGWSAKSGATLTQSSSQQWQGNNSLSVATTTTGGDGAKYTVFTLGASTQYTLSLYAKVSSGSITDVSIGRQDNTTNGEVDCLSGQTVNTNWTRFNCTFTTNGTINTNYLYIKKTGVSAETFFIDGVQLQTGSSTTAFDAGGALQFNGIINSPITFQNKSNSTTAFQIQNAAGTSNLFIADTINNSIGIGQAPTTSGFSLEVTGHELADKYYVVEGGSLESYGSGAKIFFEQAGGGGSAGGLELDTSISTGNVKNISLLTGGSVIVQNPNTNTSAVFQVQNAIGSNALTVDTTALNSLINNGNAEGTNISNWVSKQNATVTRDTTQAYIGNASIKAVLGGTTAIGDGIKYTPSPVLAATTYTLSFSVKQTAGTAFGTNLAVGWNNGSDTDCTLSPSLVAQPVPTTGWARYSCTFTGSTGATDHLYWKQTDAPASARTFFIDAVQVETGSSATGYKETGLSFNGLVKSPLTVQNSADSTTAFSVNNAAGSSIINVDTLNGGFIANATGLFRATSTSAFQVQTAGGTNLLSIDTSGSVITFSGTTSTFVTVSFTNAHVKSAQTTAPTIGTPTNCGTNNDATASVNSGSTDSAGSFVITTGTGTMSPGTCDTVFTFNKAYGAAPKAILVSSGGVNASTKAIYVSGSSSTTFTVKFGLSGGATATSEANTFYYWVVE